MGAIGCHRVCSNRVMNLARRACCNQWLRTGNNQSHVEQTSPDKNMNCQCTTAAFTVSLKPEGFVIIGSLAHETRPCMRFMGDAQSPSARTFAVRLPPHNPSRDCTCLKLVVIIGWLIRRKIRCWFTHRGLSPHKFMPMPGVPSASGEAYGVPDAGVSC